MTSPRTWGCCALDRPEDEKYINCCECNKYFHFECLSIQVISDSELLQSWKCPVCQNRRLKMTRKDSTPVRKISTARGNKRPALNSPPSACPPLTVDDVRVAVQDILDSKFEKMVAQLKGDMASMIKSELATIRNEVREIVESVTFMNAKFEDFVVEHESMKKEITELKSEKEKMKDTVKELNTRIIYLEQHSRASNLEIQCIPEHKNENLYSIAKQIGKIIGCEIEETDIAHCTRVSKVNPSSSRPRSVVLQLSSPRTRDNFLASSIKYNKTNAKARLNSALLGFSGNITPIYIVEHLSPANKALHAAARIKAKENSYKYVWVRNGKIFVRKNEESGYMLIKDMDCVAKIV
ncbi:uncharacterized protein LOC113510309 [Galleria mellonella]|uniref:Uncharacterized protein LOC113510309 n=1 Tax=Galleria mellonella TaxID=7137 RepID=A0A6J1W9B1_GALME|nr:uncharacterized protein LOC113510309 [Galleria mellonella]